MQGKYRASVRETFDCSPKSLHASFPVKMEVKAPGLEAFLHEMIPLARAMGVRIEVSDENKLVLIAPHEPNRNSLNTAFGGSLVALSTLAGYGVMWELMRNEKAEWRIVVKDSKAAYRKPSSVNCARFANGRRERRSKNLRLRLPATEKRSSSCAPRLSKKAVSRWISRPLLSSRDNSRAFKTAARSN